MCMCYLYLISGILKRRINGVSAALLMFGKILGSVKGVREALKFTLLAFIYYYYITYYLYQIFILLFNKKNKNIAFIKLQV